MANENDTLDAIARAIYHANKLSQEPEWTIVDACIHASSQECLSEEGNALVELVVTFCPQRAIKTFLDKCGVPSAEEPLPMLSPIEILEPPIPRMEDEYRETFRCTVDESEEDDDE